MSGTTSWTPDKVVSVSNALTIYNDAQAALAALAETGAAAFVTLKVAGSGGSVVFSFNLDVAQAAQFFTPIVQGMASNLTAAGVDLTPAS